MKHRHLCLAALGLLSSLGATAQPPGDKPALTAKQIVEAGVAALGGKKALDAPSHLKVKGSIEFPDNGIKGGLTVFQKGKKTLFTAEIPGLGRMRSGFDGKDEWEDDPFNGLHKVSAKEQAKTKPGEESPFDDMSLVADLNLDDYSLVELKGVEKVGDRTAYAVRMKTKKGALVVRCFDCESFLLLREYKEGKDSAISFESMYGDYRPVSDLRLPFFMSRKESGSTIVLKVTEYKLNEPIEDSVFAYPGDKPKP